MKTALLTGIGRLGVPVAERLVADGWRVVVSYRAGRASERTVAALVARCGADKVRGVTAEVVDPRQAEAFVRAALEITGRIDAIVNIASGYPDEAHWRRWQAGGAVTEADWAFYASNFILSRNVIAAALPHLADAAGGGIINFGDARSMAYFDDAVLDPYAACGGIRSVTPAVVRQHGLARLPEGTPPRHRNPYTLAKIDLACLTRVLALELGGRNIRVNTLAPGPILPTAGCDAAAMATIARQTALGRWGVPEAIVRAVMYLLENDYVTGEVLRVDGGLGLCRRFRP